MRTINTYYGVYDLLWTFPIKGVWLGMIVGEIKKEEYRDIKPYYVRRFLGKKALQAEMFLNGEYPIPKTSNPPAVAFRAGYQPDSPYGVFGLKGLEIGYPNPEWTDQPDVRCFKLILGKQIV